MGHVNALAASGPLLAFLIPGVREVVLVALVALALYGRTGSRLLLRTRYGRLLGPVLARVPARAPANKPKAPKAIPRRRGRWFWAFALTLAAAVAAWVATQAVVVKNTPPAPRFGAGHVVKP